LKTARVLEEVHMHYLPRALEPGPARSTYVISAQCLDLPVVRMCCVSQKFVGANY